MVDFNRRKPVRKFLHSPFALFVMLVVLLILLKAVWGVHGKEQTSAAYLNQQKTELDKIKARETELSNSIEYLKTDQGVEAELRSKFRVVKEGESIAVILDNDATTTEPAPQARVPTWWQRIFDR